MGWPRASCLRGGGSAGERRPGPGKVTSRTIRFLALPEPRSGPGRGAQRRPPSTPLSAGPRPTPPPAAVPPPPFKARSGPSTRSEGGCRGRVLSPAPRRPAHLPCLEWGSPRCGGAHSARRRERAARGGGRRFPFPAFPPPTPPQVSERRVPARAGGAGGGGGVGSGLCPDTCLPGRPGPAGVWREGGSLPPAPHNPHVSKGG